MIQSNWVVRMQASVLLLGLLALTAPASAQPTGPGFSDPATSAGPQGETDGTSGAKERVKALSLDRKLAVLIQALMQRLVSRAPFNSYSAERRHDNMIETLKLLGIPVNAEVPFARGATALVYARTILAAAGDTGGATINGTLDRLVDTFFTDGEIATAERDVASGSDIPGTDPAADPGTEPGGNADLDADGVDPLTLDELPTTFPIIISTVNQDTEFVDFGG